MHKIEDALNRIADAIGPRVSPLASKNPRGFSLHPDAFYGPYDVSYVGGFFPETVEEIEKIKERIRTSPATTTDPSEEGDPDSSEKKKGKKGKDHFANVRKKLCSMPGFRRPDGHNGILCQGWILARFRIPPTLTPGPGWILSPDEGREPPREKPKKKRGSQRREPTDAYKRRVESRTAQIRNAKKNSSGNPRGISR